MMKLTLLLFCLVVLGPICSLPTLAEENTLKKNESVLILRFPKHADRIRVFFDGAQEKNKNNWNAERGYSYFLEQYQGNAILKMDIYLYKNKRSRDVVDKLSANVEFRRGLTTEYIVDFDRKKILDALGPYRQALAKKQTSLNAIEGWKNSTLGTLSTKEALLNTWENNHQPFSSLSSSIATKLTLIKEKELKRRRSLLKSTKDKINFEFVRRTKFSSDWFDKWANEVRQKGNTAADVYYDKTLAPLLEKENQTKKSFENGIASVLANEPSENVKAYNALVKEISSILSLLSMASPTEFEELTTQANARIDNFSSQSESALSALDDKSVINTFTKLRTQELTNRSSYLDSLEIKIKAFKENEISSTSRVVKDIVALYEREGISPKALASLSNNIKPQAESHKKKRDNLLEDIKAFQKKETKRVSALEDFKEKALKAQSLAKYTRGIEKWKTEQTEKNVKWADSLIDELIAVRKQKVEDWFTASLAENESVEDIAKRDRIANSLKKQKEKRLRTLSEQESLIRKQATFSKTNDADPMEVPSRGSFIDSMAETYLDWKKQGLSQEQINEKHQSPWAEERERRNAFDSMIRKSLTEYDSVLSKYPNQKTRIELAASQIVFLKEQSDWMALENSAINKWHLEQLKDNIASQQTEVQEWFEKEFILIKQIKTPPLKQIVEASLRAEHKKRLEEIKKDTNRLETLKGELEETLKAFNQNVLSEFEAKGEIPFSVKRDGFKKRNAELVKQTTQKALDLKNGFQSPFPGVAVYIQLDATFSKTLNAQLEDSKKWAASSKIKYVSTPETDYHKWQTDQRTKVDKIPHMLIKNVVEKQYGKENDTRKAQLTELNSLRASELERVEAIESTIVESTVRKIENDPSQVGIDRNLKLFNARISDLVKTKQSARAVLQEKLKIHDSTKAEFKGVLALEKQALSHYPKPLRLTAGSDNFSYAFYPNGKYQLQWKDKVLAVLTPENLVDLAAEGDSIIFLIKQAQQIKESQKQLSEQTVLDNFDIKSKTPRILLFHEGKLTLIQVPDLEGAAFDRVWKDAEHFYYNLVIDGVTFVTQVDFDGQVLDEVDLSEIPKKPTDFLKSIAK